MFSICIYFYNPDNIYKYKYFNTWIVEIVYYVSTCCRLHNLTDSIAFHHFKLNDLRLTPLRLEGFGLRSITSVMCPLFAPFANPDLAIV